MSYPFGNLKVLTWSEVNFLNGILRGVSGLV